MDQAPRDGSSIWIEIRPRHKRNLKYKRFIVKWNDVAQAWDVLSDPSRPGLTAG
jgi:hypothetical protein